MRHEKEKHTIIQMVSYPWTAIHGDIHYMKRVMQRVIVVIPSLDEKRRQLQLPAITFSQHDVLGLIQIALTTVIHAESINKHQTDTSAFILCTRSPTKRIGGITDFTLPNKQPRSTRHSCLGTSDNLRSGRRDDAATPLWTGA
jgi:hypothetical protein